MVWVSWLGWLRLKFLFENYQYLPQVFSWLVGLVGLLVFELVVLFQLVVFLVGFLLRVGWLGWLGLKFLFENCQFWHHVFSLLVGLVGLLVFCVGSSFPVSFLSSWFVVSGWLVGLVGLVGV